MSATILLLNDDLLDSSRIAGHGRAVGLTVLPCRDMNAMRNALAKEPVCALLDLHNPGLDIATLVGELRTAGVKKIIGYGSHVDTTRLKAARLAGCDEVLPRSAFFDGLEEQLVAWAN
jgi:DNA-binding response OmpR family regulator